MTISTKSLWMMIIPCTLAGLANLLLAIYVVQDRAVSIVVAMICFFATLLALRAIRPHAKSRQAEQFKPGDIVIDDSGEMWQLKHDRSPTMWSVQNYRGNFLLRKGIFRRASSKEAEKFQPLVIHQNRCKDPHVN